MQSSRYTSLVLLAGTALASSALAAPTVDKDGNTGYPTAAECDAAVQAGTARFYRTVTRKPTRLQRGEKSVSAARLSDLGPQYRLGACDVGVGRRNGRDGVAPALVGKYVPYSPAMAVNVYADAAGRPVRASMGGCDNRFSDAFPRPVALPAPAPAPVPVAAAPAPQPVPAAVPAPAAPAPKGLTPYVFGTLGAVRDGVTHSGYGIGGLYPGASSYSDVDRQWGGQLGAGLQFNDWLGAELYYQGGKKHEYSTGALGNIGNLVGGLGTWSGTSYRAGAKAWGARVTLGAPITDKLRVFGKLGVARVKHDTPFAESSSQTRPTFGVGLTYALTDHLALRADIDTIRRGSEVSGFTSLTNSASASSLRWRNLNYVGVGLQYNF